VSILIQSHQTQINKIKSLRDYLSECVWSNLLQAETKCRYFVGIEWRRSLSKCRYRAQNVGIVRVTPASSASGERGNRKCP